MQNLISSAPSRRPCTEQQCLSLLQSATSLLKLLQALAFLLKCGNQSNLLVLTCFATAAAVLGPGAAAAAAALLFSPSFSPLHLYDSFLLNTSLQSLSPYSLHPLPIFSLMLRLQLPPNHFTFPFLLKAISATPSPLASTSLASADGAGLGLARKVFDESPKTSPITFSAMIGGYGLHGHSNDAIVLFRQM
ncbi:Pentatricopeptide repeat-containing protein [Platanthera zijinensis]|uniref:Pentatricopeptide repeat-containing protein n=1 Tax=Platanthera zijinensis TaxID=2320716 RepID=A0AAP0BYU0_9ASPA